MIGRIWYGWTRSENADMYEQLLKEEIFPGIADKKVPGYREIQLFRRPLGNDEVEFVTIMSFDSWEAVKRFSGEDYERAYVPPKAKEVLAEVRGALAALRGQRAPRVPVVMTSSTALVVHMPVEKESSGTLKEVMSMSGLRKLSGN